MIRKIISLFSLLLFINTLPAENTPAFPGAEGWGKYTTGGRGGSVYYVTNLEDSYENPKAGSFRYAVNQNGPRVIMFTVSGTIHLEEALNIQNGDLTIAGQTAPGDGICLADFPVNISANNVIIRFIRIRMGDLKLTDADGCDALGGRGLQNIMVDHCSCSWSTDECVSFYGNSNFTLQWCIISESLKVSKHTKGSHGYGGIWGGYHASYHHNFLVHHSSRTPRLGSFYGAYVGKEDNDLRNNVIYNHGGYGCYGGEGMRGNIVNCYYKPGPASQTGDRRGQIIGIGVNSTDKARPRWGQWYIAGNVINSSNTNNPVNTIEKRSTNDNWTYGVLPFINKDSITNAELINLRAQNPFDPGEVTTHSAEEAYKKVLAYSGCSMSRDTIDKRLVNEAKTGKTTFTESRSNDPDPGFIDTPLDLRPANAAPDWSPWPTLISKEAPLDTDYDGMPDDWEDAKGLRKYYRLDGKVVNPVTGYTYLEDYLNSLVENIMIEENKDALFTTSIEKNKNEIKENTVLISNYPAGVINLKSGSIMKSVRLYSMSGISSYSFFPEDFSFSTGYMSLNKGVYIIRVETLDGLTTKKILI